jgi:perosamine synthetase
MRVAPANIYFPPQDRRWILEQIDNCLQSGQLTLGNFGQQLEEAFADLCGVRYAVAVNSGTSALEIILRTVGVEGREVVVPTNTFFATAGAVVHAGGIPHFVDCDPASFALDPQALAQAITPRTAAVIVVHIGGLMSGSLPVIRALCDEQGIPLIEDAAHAHGSSLGGVAAGAFGLAGAFSFYPTKVVTSGEGGMIITNDENLYREARIYRDQGKEGFTTNFHVRLGYNWRLSEPHAVIGLAQLRRLPEFLEHRRDVALIYDEGLRRLSGLATPLVPPRGCQSSYYKYMVMLENADRSAVKRRMREDFDIGLSGEVYDTPCHLQPVFHAFRAGPLPQAEDICSRHICLPISATITPDDARYVLDSLAAVLEAQAAPAEAGRRSK